VILYSDECFIIDSGDLCWYFQIEVYLNPFKVEFWGFVLLLGFINIWSSIKFIDDYNFFIG